MCILIIGVAIILINIISYSFFEFGVSTTTTVARNVTTVFPVVTLCSFNFFKTDSGKIYLNDILKEFDKSEVYKKYKDNFSKSKIKLIQLRLKYAKSFILMFRDFGILPLQFIFQRRS